MRLAPGLVVMGGDSCHEFESYTIWLFLHIGFLKKISFEWPLLFFVLVVPDQLNTICFFRKNLNQNHCNEQKGFQGSGCGVVGIAVASDARYPQLESSHRKIYLLAINWIEKAKINKKESKNGQILKGFSFDDDFSKIKRRKQSLRIIIRADYFNLHVQFLLSKFSIIFCTPLW